MNPLEYKINVMNAALAGRKIEFKLHSSTDWQFAPVPYWDWLRYDYRIAPTIAAGHNPDQLTEEQVEVDKGWRLLAPEEIQERPVTADIQMWVDIWTTFHANGSIKAYTYRTLRPPGYFLPKTRPTTAKDWEEYPVIWVRDRKNTTRHELVHIIRPEDFGYGFHVGLYESFESAKTYLEWSPDRINWRPFTVNE